MEREIATQISDLPHVAHRGRDSGDNCYCGRPIGDELHGQRARELARDYDPAPVLQTEKGA